MFSCIAAAETADTLSVDTCGDDILYPTKLERKACDKLRLSDNFMNNMEDADKKRVILDITKDIL